ncbi:MAG: GAF domain-containing protein, partial [Acidobacteriota bacterium]|nr:GAF domain-containing protein [Acidobacteriota bacterium]
MTKVVRQEEVRAPAVESMKQPSPPKDFASPHWEEAQDALALAADLALLLIAGHQPPSLVTSNNNSICRTLQSSPQHAHLCEPFCGKAYERAHRGEGEEQYRCHAGLHCIAVPVEIERRELAIIGGRAFLTSADYRALAERVRAGDLKDLPLAELFDNVIFTARANLEQMPARLAALANEYNRRVEPEKSAKPGEQIAGVKDAASKAKSGAAQPAGDSSSQINFPPGISLRDACRAAIESLLAAHDITSSAVLLRLDEAFTPVYTTGEFSAHPPRITMSDKPASETARRGSAANRKLSIVAGSRDSLRVEWDMPVHEARTGVFPLVIADETKGALVVATADRPLGEDARHAISRFSRDLALPLEVLRLREELERRVRAAYHLQTFTERVSAVEPEEAYSAILRHSVDLLHAERGSIQLYDEESNQLEVKAAMGLRAEVTREARMNISEGVSGAVLREGRPLVVRDMEASGHELASPERLYKTNSFLSYPIIVSGRRVGVLNVTDKTGGGAYTEKDVGMLDMIAPQMALALDRAEWHQKATQFQLLSITD